MRGIPSRHPFGIIQLDAGTPAAPLQLNAAHQIENTVPLERPTDSDSQLEEVTGKTVSFYLKRLSTEREFLAKMYKGFSIMPLIWTDYN